MGAPKLAHDLGMSPSARQEGFGDGFILALAGTAGCATSMRRPDDDSIDWTLSCKLASRPKLDLQVKTWVGDDGKGDHLNYSLKVKNYNDLVIDNLMTPRILVLVSIPKDAKQWTLCTPEKLEMYRSAYWVSLRGQPYSANQETVTVKVPRVNLFNADELQRLMALIDKGLPL